MTANVAQRARFALVGRATTRLGDHGLLERRALHRRSDRERSGPGLWRFGVDSGGRRLGRGVRFARPVLRGAIRAVRSLRSTRGRQESRHERVAQPGAIARQGRVRGLPRRRRCLGESQAARAAGHHRSASGSRHGVRCGSLLAVLGGRGRRDHPVGARAGPRRRSARDHPEALSPRDGCCSLSVGPLDAARGRGCARRIRRAFHRRQADVRGSGVSGQAVSLITGLLFESGLVELPATRRLMRRGGDSQRAVPRGQALLSGLVRRLSGEPAASLAPRQSRVVSGELALRPSRSCFALWTWVRRQRNVQDERYEGAPAERCEDTES